jgi:hypothetical protein
MSEAGERELRDPPSLGELLALLHRADAAFDRVATTYRIWRHEQRASAARQAHVEQEQRRGAAITSFAFSDDSDRPVEIEEVLRVWRAEDRVREEHEGGSRDGAYLVRDGDAWWTWDQANGAHSNEGDVTLGYSDGEQISLMLDPTPLLGTLRFTPTGRARVAGRETITASAVPRLSDRRDGRHVFELYQLGGGADRYALQVDAERGVLLEAVAFREGEPFQRITTEQVAFDHAIEAGRFRFVAPTGEEIQPAWSQHRVRHVPLAQAQQLAPFTVLVPERNPSDWGASYAFIEPSQRPPSPACVSINYRSDDGHERVSLSQYAVGDQPNQYNLMLKRDDWQTITRDGTDVKVRAGSQTQAHVERHETFVFLTSETLTVEQLAIIAAGLKPAPTAPASD